MQETEAAMDFDRNRSSFVAGGQFDGGIRAGYRRAENSVA